MAAYPGAAIDLQVQPDGSLKDTVSGNLATITRLGQKLGVSPVTGLLEAVEGSATNFLLNSGFEADSNSDGIANNWTGGNGTPSIVDGMGGGKAQRFTNVTADGSVLYQNVVAGSFADGETAIVSAWVKGDGTRTFDIRAQAFATGTIIGTIATTPVVPPVGWTRWVAVYPNLPATTNRVQLAVRATGGSGTGNIDVAQPQVEKAPAGALLPSSYIATTTAAVTRNGKLFAEAYTSSAEPERTNYLLNSSFEVDTNADGLSDSWATNNSVAGAVTYSRPAGVFGSACQRIQYTSAADATKVAGILGLTPAGSCVPGDVITMSLWAKGAVAGCILRAKFNFYAANGTSYIGSGRSLDMTTLKGDWARFDLGTSGVAPANTSRCMVIVEAYNVDTGDTVDVYIDGIQLEQGTGLTSFIPTTTAPVTRPAATARGGYWAAIEEARTNYLLNSSFEVDTNTDGTPDNWSFSGSSTNKSCVASTDAVHGTKAVRLQASGTSAGSSAIFSQLTAVETFAAGASATLSVYVRSVSIVGSPAVQLQAQARDAAGAFIASVSSPVITAPGKVSLSYATLPANTSRVTFLFGSNATLDVGESFDIVIDAAQAEPGAFATSFIPTTTVAVTRPADIVTYPSAALGTRSVSGGETVAAVAGCLWSQITPNRAIVSFQSTGGLNNLLNLRAGGSYNIAAAASAANGNAVAANRATGTKTVGTPIAATFRRSARVLSAYADGTTGTDATLAADVDAYGSGIVIGAAYDSNQQWLNGSLHRVAIFNTALTDLEIAALSTAILEGVSPTSRFRALPFPIGV